MDPPIVKMPDESPDEAAPEEHLDDLINQLVDGADETIRAKDKQLAFSERYQELMKKGEATFSGATDFMAERITDPQYASSMEDNRGRVLRAEEVARRVYAAIQNSDENRAKELQALSEDLRRNGALFERYDPEETKRKILDENRYVYVRSGAKVLMPDTAEYSDFMWGAEMRTSLASQDPKEALITDIPDPSDPNAVFYSFKSGDPDFSKRLAEQMRKNPSQIAVIDDVYTYEHALRRHRVASHARQLTETIIDKDINPARVTESQIRYYIANMFRLEGIQFGDEDEIHDFTSPIANEISIMMHACTEKFNATLTWALPAKPIETEFVPEGGNEADIQKAKLYVGWETVVLGRRT